MRIANGLQIAVALGGLAWLAAAARAAARDREGRAVLISGALLWGLLSLPFQRFSMLLAIPAWGFVLWSPSIVKSERHRAWLMLGFVLMHVLDLPLLVHALTFALTPDPFRSSWTLAVHRLGEFHSFDALRIAVVALFAVVARTARSQAAARSQVRRPAVT